MAFSVEDEYVPVDYYYVASEKASDKVASDKVLIKGKVWEGFSLNPVSKGLVSNFTRSSFAYTNDTGYYEMEIAATDTALFFYHEKYKELVCWSYHFKGGHIVELNWITSNKLPDGIYEVQEKPVIYLYPDKKTKVSVKLDEQLSLTTTYPRYENGWSVMAHPNGTLEANNRTFPYLFWEGETKGLSAVLLDATNHKQSENIATDTAVSYLENVLSANGLNEKESTDFITYWAPRLQVYDYATVTFLVDEEFDEHIGSMEVSPKPQNSKRIYILFAGASFEMPLLTNPPMITYSKVNREGFTLIEWGGTDLTSSTLDP